MKRFKPLVDKLFYIILIPTAALLAAATVVPAVFDCVTLFFTIPIDLFAGYFLISPLFGYVELRDESLYIKYGFILKKEIAYAKIRGFEKERRSYSDSIFALKNSFEHVNIKYNKYDITAVSVRENDDFIRELCGRCQIS